MPGSPLKRCRRLLAGIRTGAIPPSEAGTIARLLPLIEEKLKQKPRKIPPAAGRTRARIDHALGIAAGMESKRQGRVIAPSQLRAMIVRAWLEAHPEYSKLL